MTIEDRDIIFADFNFFPGMVDEDYHLNYIFEKWEIEQMEKFVDGLGNKYKRKILLLADDHIHNGPWYAPAGLPKSRIKLHPGVNYWENT